jgi:uncharacterized protein (TIGR03000 family)
LGTFVAKNLIACERPSPFEGESITARDRDVRKTSRRYIMLKRLVKLLAPAALFFVPTPAFAQHHGGGHGGGGHGGGVYHGGGGVYRGGGAYRGGYYGGSRGYYGGYRGYGYGGYGYGYPLFGYGLGYGGLGYGLGYGSLGYGLGYGGYGLGSGGYGYSYPYSSSYYSYPDYSGYTYPDYSSYSYPITTSTPVINSVVPASGVYSSIPSTSAPSSTPAPATVTVVVPENAQVWFDGKETSETGHDRVFTSATLQPDQSSVLEVKARWDGSTRTMQLPIRAGDKISVELH